MRTSLTLRPITPLRRLLAEYRDIGEQIRDGQADLTPAMVWPDRKGVRKRRRPCAA